MSTWGACHTCMVDAEGIAICRRPRLYWVSSEIHQSPGVQPLPVGNGSWTDYTCVTLTAEIDAANYILKGWKLSAGQKLPTFTTSRPRLTPGNKPAGLWQCEPWEVERWENDLHRFPPYVYRDKHCLQNAHGEH